MSCTYDVAVAGSGFAGSLIAMIAKRLGYSVVLLERGKHPRFMIGESSTPLSNLIFEEIATRYDLPKIRPFAKWGSWQETYPQIPCGLKRGFTFYHHKPDEAPATPYERSSQLLVAASPHDRISDTHWYRADFDAFFATQAQQLGVDYFDEVKLDRFTPMTEENEIAGRRHESDVVFRARFLIDATGPRGFLHHALKLTESALPSYPPTQALYSHFTGIGAQVPSDSEAPPYPPEDAAVHHLFNGGWIWILRFNNGITSAGAAMTDWLAEELKLREGASAWQRLLRSLPALAPQFEQAMPAMPFIHAPRLSFRSSTIAADRWALLPSAAGFVDPLLSTGFPLTLLGVERLAKILEQDFETNRMRESLQRYAAQTEGDLLAASQLLAALYANLHRFSVFSALTMLYFAAASYSETARRLGKPYLAPSFLLHTHPVFGRSLRDLTHRAMSLADAECESFCADAMQAIEPFDVAGLCRTDRNHWYPVDAEDLRNGASKVYATQAEVQSLLYRCGF